MPGPARGAGAIWTYARDGGPQVLTVEEMAATYLRLQGRKASVRSEPIAGALFDVFRTGINLIPTHTDGTITWETFVEQVKTTARDQ